MNDEQLIETIKSLKEIKPDTHWVSLAKKQIFSGPAIGQGLTMTDFIRGMVLQFRYVLSSLVLIGLTAGTVIAAQGALPGDALYPIKKVSERGLAIITAKKETPQANLQLAEKRLEELNKVTQQNLVQNLPSAVEEYKKAKTVAKKEVSDMVKKNPDQATRIVRQISTQMKEMDNKEKTVLGALGADADTLSTDSQEGSSDAVIVELLIAGADKVILTYDKQIDLEKVKEYYADKEYSKALDYYLNSSLNK